MAQCEDYPCCGHTDGLGCDYTPDYDYIYKHVGCDHEAGHCQLRDEPEEADDDTCETCGGYMNYTFGVEGEDYVQHYTLRHSWDDEFIGVRYEISHWECVPEGSALIGGDVNV